MDTTAPRPALGRRLVRGTAAVVATLALGLGLSAGTAAAEPPGGGSSGGDNCEAYNKNMDDARYFAVHSTQLNNSGHGDLATKADAEAEYYLQEAEAANAGGTCKRT